MSKENRTWCDDALDLFEAIEPETDPSWGAFDVNASPEPFIRHAMKELLSALMPAAALKKGMDFTPHRAGALIGHKWRHCQTANKAITRLLREKKTPEDWKSLLEHLKVSSTEVKRVRKALHKAFVIALDQEPRDVAQFLEGFKKAMESGSYTPTGGLAGSGTRTPLCLFVLFCGPNLPRLFPNVNAFHDAATRVFGHNAAGSLERFQKFCQSIELSFARRGRPKKNRKTLKRTTS